MSLTLEQAIGITRELEPKFAAFGYHLALTGGVLFRGESNKDIDFVFYAHDPQVSLTINQVRHAIAPEMDMFPRIKPRDEYRNRNVIKAIYRGVPLDFLEP